MSGNEDLKPNGAAGPSEAGGQGDLPLRSRVLSGLNALGWSATIAALAALATCAGMARQAGRSSALALYSLSRPALDQRNTMNGVSCILSAALLTLLPAAAAYLVYRLSVWALRKTSIPTRIGGMWAKAGRIIPWIAFVLVLADVGLLNAGIFKLMAQAEGVILKHTPEAGMTWTKILLDDDLTTADGYRFLFGTAVALFVGIAWWLVEAKIEKRFSRICFSFWVAAQVLSLLLGYSYLVGVTDSIGEFPIVTFSNAEQLMPHYCPILLDSDDRQFALLIVNCQEKPEGLQKYVLYLPRTEVKWMTVVRMVQLQPLARLDDMKRLLQDNSR